MKKIILLIIVLAFCTLTTDTFAQVYGWSPLGGGINGNVYAIAYYNNRLIVAGGFTQAGGVSVNNIAQWDSSGWSPLAGGLSDTVYALFVDTTSNPNLLYAGGSFSTDYNHVAKWNGNTWTPVVTFTQGSGIGGNVRAITSYNGIIFGGEFTIAGTNTSANHIVRWVSNQWQQIPPNSNNNNGLNDNVYSFSIFNGKLIVGGKFTQTNSNLTVNHVASWDEGSWLSLGSGINGSNANVYALTVYNGNLYAGGNFTTAGGNSALNIAFWNGSGWGNLAQQVDNSVYALNLEKGQLVAGGAYKWAGNIFGSRVAEWNGTSWTRMITGTNNSVNVLFTKDSSIYAGGTFTTAGGDYRYHIAVWNWLQTHTISGQVRYADSLTFVHHGFVEALRLDVATREIILVDSTSIISNDSGSYTLSHIPVGDSLYIASFPDDEEEDNFVPTYHSSTIDWTSAVKVFPNTNLTNINVNVFRVIPSGNSRSTTYNISGYVYLNFTPTFFSTGYPFWSGSIVYAQQGSLFRGFGITDINEYYTIPNMAPGTYSLFANRIGYNSGNRTIVLGTSNYDTANFYLDTFGAIGIHKIGEIIPVQYRLEQNYPNPFNPVTTIKFSVPNNGNGVIKLSVFNILGQEIAILVNESLKPGDYKYIFNASDLPSGVYFYKLQAGSFSNTRKMILIK